MSDVGWASGVAVAQVEGGVAIDADGVGLRNPDVDRRRGSNSATVVSCFGRQGVTTERHTTPLESEWLGRVFSDLGSPLEEFNLADHAVGIGDAGCEVNRPGLGEHCAISGYEQAHARRLIGIALVDYDVVENGRAGPTIPGAPRACKQDYINVVYRKICLNNFSRGPVLTIRTSLEAHRICR